MKFIKIYNFVKIFTTLFMTVLFIVIDLTILYFRDFILYLFFIPIEILFILFWLLILRFNKTTVYRIKTDKGRIEIITYEKNYTVQADRIKVKRGRLYYFLYFDDVKLKANGSSKSVKAFLHKYQNIYKRIK